MRLSVSIAETVARRSPESRALVVPVAGGSAVFAGAGGPANKVIGVGFGEKAADLDGLDLVEPAWRERGEPVRFEVASLADPALASALTARGYRLAGFENVSGRRLGTGDTPPALPAGFAVEQLPESDWRLWMEVALDGFEAPDGSAPHEERYPRDVLEAAFVDFAAAPGFHRFVPRVDGVPAGAATMRLDDGLAQLSGAATLPAFRRRGVQSALLSWRLAMARAAGCDLAVVTTQPGSKSQANVIRQGFALLFARAILIAPLDAHSIV